ncbi:MAG: hypothetical protein RL701_6606 [Pseudomonadota bacterium]|jgi:hypothetical protein
MPLASAVSLPIQQLIGAPLVAIVEAEALAARATAEFIQEVGFSRDPSDKSNSFGTLRTVKFTYRKQNVNSQVVVEEIELPLLSIVVIPALQVKSAEIELNLRLSEVEEVSTQPSVDGRARASNPALATLATERVQFKGTFAPDKPASSNSSSSVDLKVKINVVQADITTGLSKLFQIFDTALTSKPVPAEPEREPQPDDP